MPHRVTVRDIAQKAGVSKSTVSLALRDHPRITPAVRAHVRAVADELGYTPDPLLSHLAANGWSALREKSTTTIAFLTGGSSARSPYGASYYEPLRGHAARLGYKIDLLAREDFPDAARVAEVLRARGIRGLLVHALADVDFVQSFPWRHFACVACSVGIATPPVHLVTSDFCHPMLETWKHCLRAGYRRIGVALLKEMSAHDDLPRSAIAEYLEHHSLKSDTASLPVQHFAVSEKTAFLDWMRAEKPDVVIALNDIFHWWLDEAGYRMPEQIGFVSLLIHPTEPQVISGWNSRDDLVAKSSLEQLDLLLRSAEFGLPPNPYTLLIRPV